MKFLFVLLIIPVFSIGQTVHIKDDKIVYEGRENIPGLSAEEIYRKVQKALSGLVRNYINDTRSVNSVRARGELKLKTPYTIIRTVSYLSLYMQRKTVMNTRSTVYFLKKK